MIRIPSISAALILVAVGSALQIPADRPGTIWLAVNVIHKDGHLVTDLTARDFEIEHNGQVRQVTSFRSDSIPIALALMIDVSASMESNYGLIRRAVRALTSKFEPGDRAIIGAFNALPWIGNRFTARQETLLESLTGVFSEGLFLCDGDWIDKTAVARGSLRSGYGRTSEFSRRMRVHGGSAIWDGAACGINAVASDGETPRRVVILMTDGMDTMSFSSVASVVERANRLGVIVYAISLMGGYGMAGAELKGLAEGTGGGYFFLSDDDKVEAAFIRIGEELRRQYIFGFDSNGPLDGAHAISVKSRVPETTTRFRRVQMQIQPTRPLSGRSVILPPSPPPSVFLPAGFTDSAGDPVRDSAASPPSPAARTPLWDTLDQFMQEGWVSGNAPRMKPEELRSMAGMLRQQAPAWINAAAPAARRMRRVAVAAFVLDLLYSQNDPHAWLDGQPAMDLIEWTARILREDPPAPEERLWALGAIALLERAGAHSGLDRFAVEALRRFADEGRFVLARAVAQDLRTWPEDRDGKPFSPEPELTNLLVSRYEAATKFPNVKVEATLRLAYFDMRRGRVDEALARMASIAEEQSSDITLRYWISLLSGRMLEEAGQLDRAIEFFEVAQVEFPGAPSSRAALVAALAKAGRHADAARAATTALASEPVSIDPWTMYVLPDMRYWDAINAHLGKVIRR